MIKYNFRLDEETMADILAMAEHVGKPGNKTAGLCALIAEWRTLKAERTGFYEMVAEWRRLKAAEEAAMDFAAQVGRHEEYLDALDRHEEADGQ